MELRGSNSPVAELKENYINGDLGFDPLGLMPIVDFFRTEKVKFLRISGHKA